MSRERCEDWPPDISRSGRWARIVVAHVLFLVFCLAPAFLGAFLAALAINWWSGGGVLLPNSGEVFNSLAENWWHLLVLLLALALGAYLGAYAWATLVRRFSLIPGSLARRYAPLAARGGRPTSDRDSSRGF